MKHQCGIFDILYTMFIPLCALICISPIAIFLWFLRRNSCHLVNTQGKEVINMFITHIVIICAFVVLLLVGMLISPLGYPLVYALVFIGTLLLALFYTYYSIGLAISCVYVLLGRVFHFHRAIHICKDVH